MLKNLVSLSISSVRTKPTYWRRLLSLPSHQVVGMPALSPTMTAGTIGKWTCNVGDKISAGSSIAEIETDKASITFEAQDEFFIAKFLVEPGAEVPVGDPIFVSVDDESSIPSFATFTVSKKPAAIESSTTKDVSTPAPTPAVTPSPTPAPAPTPVAVPVVNNQPTATVKTPSSPPPAPAVTTVTLNTAVWGTGVVKSSIALKLANDHLAYNKKYGRSSHSPIGAKK